MAQLKSKALHIIGNQLFRYIYKNPKDNMLKLVRLGDRFAGRMYPDATFKKAMEIVSDDSNIWHSYLFNGLEDIDRDFLRKAVLTFGIDLGLIGTQTIRERREVEHCNIPWVILLDPTSACNLKCKGCWAAEYGHHSSLTLDEMRRIVTEAKALGTHFFMYTGGEPLIKKQEILTVARENPDCLFLAYTNATLVDDKFCEDMKATGNLGLALSIEGNEEINDSRRGEGVYQKTLAAMRMLRQHKCLFGASVCYTSKNYDSVTSDEFYDMLISEGAKFAWYFHYMPVGSEADVSLLLTPEQRETVYRRIRQNRNSKTGKPIFTVDFQNDGEFVGGCIAGGRNYFHINSEGDAEPCVFVHYSDSNIREKSVLECLKSPLFREYYKGQPFNDNMLRPCPMLENPEALVKLVNKTSAKSTNLSHAESAEELCAKCVHYAEHWAPKAKEIWEEQERFHPFTQYYRDTEEAKQG